ncbi:MAG: winged helix-turn-helix domain-containing protein [Novosphingobium sp.]|nr:winged helix-turn-helix domain-containing protein [Novosphingobium sp.]
MSAPPCFCPCCGHNLTVEQPIVLGPLAYDPREQIRWHGDAMPLTASEFLLLGSLIQAEGKLVTKDVLAERIGYDGAGDASNLIGVLVCRIRRHLRRAGAPDGLIVTELRRGVRLDRDRLQRMEPAPCP